MKPLFNKHLLNHQLARFELDLSDAQQQAVAEWVATVRKPTFTDLKEKPLQGVFLNDVFNRLLGYNQVVGHDERYHMKAETATEEVKGGKTPDARLGFYDPTENATLAVVELKAPGADLDARQHRKDPQTPVEQAFGYVFEDCKWVIVSNFVTVRLYRTVRGEGYYHVFHLAELDDETKLREFVFLLGRDNLIGDGTKASPVETLASETHTQEERITKEFYRFYHGVRLRLFRRLVKDNPPVDGTDRRGHEIRLLEKTQKILDRVLFVCFCEDTGLLPPGVIRKALQAAGAGFVRTTRWQQILGLFEAIDQGRPDLDINRYNGGLFERDEQLRVLMVSDDILDDCLHLSEYDFETNLNVNILGQIFEQSITDLETLRADIQGEQADRQKSKRKKEGVFYTPEFVTRYIVEHTVGAYLEERFAELEAKHQLDKIPASHTKRRREAETRLWQEYEDVLRTVKVLDPACGSGAFLVACFDYLHAEYERAGRKLAELRTGTTIQRGLFDLDRQILQENLYGVDVNPESVEITKLSLWLKTAQTDKPLNNLDENIQCGNSLIAPPSEPDTPLAVSFEILPEDVKAQAFDWQRGFRQVFEQGGFDCVIGNPPYIRHERISPLKPYLENRYASYSGTADIYIYFIELGLRLLRQDGMLGYITSGTFSRAKFAANFRHWLPTEARFEKLVNFGENQPFEDAEMVYPTISILRKSTTPLICRSLFIHDKIPASIENALEEEGVDCSDQVLSNAEWVFQDSSITEIANRMFSCGVPLGSCSSLNRGVTTGLNDVFVIDDSRRNELIAQDPNCQSIIKRMYGGEDLRPWYQEKTSRWLVFTRRGINIDLYPSVKAYLEQYRDRLEPKPSKWKGSWRGRKSGAYQWYEIQDSVDYYSAFETRKIFWPDITKLPRFSLDETGTYLSNSGYILSIDSPWILSILQSRVIWFCISQIATPLRLRGGLWQYRCINQFMERLPIADVSESDKETLNALVIHATDIANERYGLHESVRHRILTDLGGGNGKLNQKLTSWWNIDFPTFRNHVKKVLKKDIPLRERAEWEKALDEWGGQHDQFTRELIDVEVEMNDRVYKLYGLSESDIQRLEEHMIKSMINYPFGGV